MYRTFHQSHSPIPATRNARRVDSSKPFTLSLSPLFKPTPLTTDIQHIHILSSFLPEEFSSSPITLKLRPILTRQLPSLGFVGSVSLPSSAHHPRTPTNHLVQSSLDVLLTISLVNQLGFRTGTERDASTVSFSSFLTPKLNLSRLGTLLNSLKSPVFVSKSSLRFRVEHEHKSSETRRAEIPFLYRTVFSIASPSSLPSSTSLSLCKRHFRMLRSSLHKPNPTLLPTMKPNFLPSLISFYYLPRSFRLSSLISPRPYVGSSEMYKPLPWNLERRKKNK